MTFPKVNWSALMDMAIKYAGVAAVALVILHMVGLVQIPTPKPAPVVPDISLPENVTGQAGVPIDLTATTASGAPIKWHFQKGLGVRKDAAGDTVTVWGQQGTYQVLAWTTKASKKSHWWQLFRLHHCEATDAQEVTVVIGEPGPGPNPPGPVDPFQATLQAAWASETAPDKATKRDLLANLYSQAATGAALDKSNDTAGKLLTVLHAAAQSLIVDALPNVRKAIAVELSTKLPTSPSAPLDDATRKTCSDQFARMSKLLGGIK